MARAEGVGQGSKCFRERSTPSSADVLADAGKDSTVLPRLEKLAHGGITAGAVAVKERGGAVLRRAGQHCQISRTTKAAASRPQHRPQRPLGSDTPARHRQETPGNEKRREPGSRKTFSPQLKTDRKHRRV